MLKSVKIFCIEAFIIVKIFNHFETFTARHFHRVWSGFLARLLSRNQNFIKFNPCFYHYACLKEYWIFISIKKIHTTIVPCTESKIKNIIFNCKAQIIHLNIDMTCDFTVSYLQVGKSTAKILEIRVIKENLIFETKYLTNFTN